MGRQHQGMDRPGEQWRTGKWRKLVVKLSVVAQRPSQLRDWWWWDGEGLVTEFNKSGDGPLLPWLGSELTNSCSKGVCPSAQCAHGSMCPQTRPDALTDQYANRLMCPYTDVPIDQSLCGLVCGHIAQWADQSVGTSVCKHISAWTHHLNFIALTTSSYSLPK